jgi:nucleotide-binding universal stress UspA family protein
MKILLPLDGSDCANKTMDWAADTFDKQTTEYYLIFVMPIVTDIPVAESTFAEATIMLQRAQSELEKRGCLVGDSEYLLGFPVDRICEYAETQEMDMVVMGSHGRTGLSKLLMGSVSEGVLTHCRRPVILVKNIGVQLEDKKPPEYPLSHTIL